MPQPRKSQNDEALEMYQAGMSLADIAHFFSVSRQSMWEALTRRGCEFRPNVRRGQENHNFNDGHRAPIKVKIILKKAIRNGVIVRKLVCEKCGETKVYKNGRTGIHAHHCDYNKPLDLMWLCDPCHKDWHRHNKAIPLKKG